MALHFHGGICLLDHDVDAQQKLSPVLRGVEMFGSYEYDGRISTRIFGATKALTFRTKAAHSSTARRRHWLAIYAMVGW